MFGIKNNEKNKSAVILNPERSEWVSRSHVTSVESVVNDGAKTQCYSAKRDLYGDFAYAQPLKMTEKALSFLSRCCTGKKQKKSSLILRKAKFQAIFKFVLSSASGGAGGGKYNRIPAFVSMSVLLIGRSLEKIFKKIFRDDFSFFVASPKDTFYRYSEPKAKNPKSNIKEWILRFANASLRMTIPMLALLFTIATTAESWAASDCAEGEQNCWDCGKTARDLCTARLNTTTKALSITGSGEMKDYEGYWNNGNPILNTPWGTKTFTSVSVNGVKNIGNSAFEFSEATIVSIGDSVNSIGDWAFEGNFKLYSVDITDSIVEIKQGAFFNTLALQKSIFISDSVTDIETFYQASLSSTKGPFDRNNGGNTLYCAETTPCYSYIASNIKTYTKDSDGVYKIGNNYFASPDDMLANRSCGSGSSASQDCINAAKTYQEQKAENMAGGALCATKQDCLKLIDRANKKDVCTSIADCAFRENCSKQGNVVYNNECLSEYPFAKKRWTPAEANKWLHDGNDNFVVLTFKK